MLARAEVRLGLPVDLLEEQVVPAKVESVPIAVPHLMVLIRWIHDEAGDTTGVAGPEADSDDAPVEGPVRGDPKGEESVVIGYVDDGVSVEISERDADHGKAAIIGPVTGNAKGVVGHDDCIADVLMLNR